ncbi:hypothetical protein OK074_5263 [Actinobacteria bacterium OK074]|nr:hypothetical protein OK074_5263 [Actinobacteria bacterium OK074]
MGSALVAQLAGAGAHVRALSRTPRNIPGVESVVGDLNRPATFADALAGVRGLFLLPGYDDLPGLLALAVKAGVERVVLMSGGSAATGDLDNAVAAYMIHSERAVQQSGLGWTLVRPGAFMSNALRWLPQLNASNFVRVPFPTVRVAPIDPYDIAAVAAQALLNSGHEGRIYPVSGPQSLLPEEQITILGEVLDRPLRCLGLTDYEARAEMEATMPMEYVDAFFSFYVDGTLDESQVLPTVEQVTGHPPRTFAEWAREHAAEFRA